MMKSNYWSCSKFADWLRGTNKLKSGTQEQWRVWEQTARMKKLRYWLAEVGLDGLQTFICWPIDRLSAIKSYINCRYIWKSHALSSHLRRGEYYDLDTRLLHAVFDELVNFVEVELAWMQVVFDKTARKKYQVPWHRTFLRLRIWRNANAGLAYLHWASTLTYDKDWVNVDNPLFGKPTPQASAAKEIQSLYHWWKNNRPHRVDPMEASGWYKFNEEKKQMINDGLDNFSSENDKALTHILERCQQIEQAYEDEDTAMLIRLIKIRAHLWT